MESLIGTSLGQYEIREKVGRGGMAHVFKAYQPGLDRFVAVKVLSPAMAEEEGFAERFQREARSIARLQHPNILQVHDSGRQGKYYYIVMRYVANSQTLGDLIRDNVPVNQIIKYLVQVADALNYAHQQGIIHRDVKPSNILIDGEWALLSDFGLVKMSEGSSELTGTGTTMGTPAYMSPEQATGKNVDHRTDIYALGVILHRALIGTIPHEATTPLAIALKRSTEPVPSLRSIKADIPESLEHVTLKALAIKPDARYSTASDFAKALKTAETDPDFRERTITDMVGDATILSSPPVREKKKGLSVGVMAAVGLAAVAIIGLLVFFLFLQPTTAQPQDNSGGTAALNIAANSPTDTPAPKPPTPVPGAPKVLVNTLLDVRSGPGEVYGLVGKLPEGAEAEITGQDETGQWWQIVFLPAEGERGWIPIDANFSEPSNTNSVPIAVAPALPTDTPTPIPDTPTPTAVPDTPTPTSIPNTLTPTATSTQPPATTATSAVAPTPTATNTPALPTGEFVLLKPISLDDPSFGPTEFEWQWGSPLKENQGFEVRVWRDGEPPAGVHNSVLDNQNGVIEALGNNTYRLIADITNTPGVLNRGGEYNWTVILIQLDPYQELGVQAKPSGRFRFDVPGGGGGGDGGGGGGGGGSPGI